MPTRQQFKNTETLEKLISELSDQCVKCGLCLQKCPTYLTEGIESESPRGRVAIISAMLSGDIEISKTLLKRLDHCLCCRKCESLCPAQVKYGKIIDLTRYLLTQKKPKPWFRRNIEKISIRLLHNKGGILNSIRVFFKVYEKSKIRNLKPWRLIIKTLGLSNAEQILPDNHQYPKIHIPDKKTDIKNKSVWLFAGCMGKTVDTSAVNASIAILKKLGFDVKLPNQQSCCGALALHSGDINSSLETAINNINQFSNDNLPIVYIATGCGSVLEEYKDLLIDTEYENDASSFSERSIEITDFLNSIEIDNTFFSEMNNKIKVAVHVPCSHQNCIGNSNSQIELLNKIPHVETTPLSTNDICCGAAGSYMLTNREISQRLLKIKVDDIFSISPDIVSSTNIGCVLHIKNGISNIYKHENGITIPVIHPVEIFSMFLK